MTLSSAPVTTTGYPKLRQVMLYAVPFVGMFIMALLLWLPFGFKTTGLIEELTITEQFDAGHSLFFITPDSVMAISRSRPLQMFFFNSAYVLDPNSYQFYQIFMMVFFFGKMVATYWLVLHFLPGKKLLAFITGALFMLYPADTGLFPLRTIHIHSATLAYLLAFYLLIQFYKQRGTKGWMALIGAGILLIFSLGQYQIALAAAVVTPLTLLYFGRSTRRILMAAAGWYIAMAVILGYELWAAGQPGIEAYEAVLLPTATAEVSPIRSILKAVLMGYQRQIVGWWTAINKLNSLPLYWVYIVTGLVISAGIGWWILRQKRQEYPPQPISQLRYMLVFFTGIALFPIGIATYLPLPNYRFEEFRIYLLAMLGSAVVLALLLYFLSRLARSYKEPTFIALALPFIALGYLNALEQHQRYANFSLEQQNILQQTAVQAPQPKPNTTIVVIDPVGALNKAYVFYYGSLLQSAFRYLYSDPTLKAYYCPVYNSSADDQKCVFEPKGLRISTLPNTIPYDQTLLFMTEDKEQLKLLTTDQAAAAYNITGYYPDERIAGRKPPLRASTLFSCVPALSCIRKPDASQTFFMNSSFDLPRDNDIGFGWRELEVDKNGETFHWSVNRISTVDVNLSADNDLVIEFKVIYWMDEALLNSLKLSSNGQDIPLSFTPIEQQSRLYRGIIPRSTTAGQLHTELVFTVDHLVPVVNDPTVQLGFALASLQIRPA